MDFWHLCLRNYWNNESIIKIVDFSFLHVCLYWIVIDSGEAARKQGEQENRVWHATKVPSWYQTRGVRVKMINFACDVSTKQINNDHEQFRRKVWHQCLIIQFWRFVLVLHKHSARRLIRISSWASKMGLKCVRDPWVSKISMENAMRPKNASELTPAFVSVQRAVTKYQTDPANTHLEFGMLLVTIMFHPYQVRYHHLYQLTSSATINCLYIHVCVTRSKNPTERKYSQEQDSYMNLLAAP